MKFLFDLFPVILFFAAFKLFDIWVATGVAIAASVAQVAWVLARGKKVDPMLWISLAIIVIAGGATLIFHDERFIKWKPTVLYLAMSAALAIAQFGFRRMPMKSLMGAHLTLPDAAWTKLTVAWVLFFIFMAGLNLVIAFNFPTEIWVNFKVFGGGGMVVLFVILQSFWLARYLPDEANPGDQP